MCQQIGKRWKRISAWMVVVSALAGMQGLGPLSLPGAGQAAASTALSIAPARYANAIEQGQKVALELVGRGIPGVSVAVAVNGEIVWSDGFGYADLEERVPVWPSTRFRIGSISKSLTADALAQLVHGLGHLGQVLARGSGGPPASRVDFQMVASEALDPADQLDVLVDDLLGDSGVFELRLHGAAI